MPRLTRLGLAALLAMAPLAACSDGADKPLPAADSARPDVPELEITGLDYAFEVKGSPTAGLMKISFTNEGKEEHMTGLGRLRDGQTIADVERALQSGDESAFGAVFHEEEGDLDAPQVLSPGYAASTYTSLNAGTYALVCFIPSPDGAPHFAKGMLSELTVAPAPTGETDRAEVLDDEVVELSFADGELTGPSTLPAGRTTFGVSTDANHELIGVVGLDGKTPDEGYAYIEAKFGGESPPTGPAEGAIVLQLHDFEPGDDIVFELDLPKGDVMFLCTLQGEESAAPHEEKLTVTVT